MQSVFPLFRLASCVLVAFSSLLRSRGLGESSRDNKFRKKRERKERKEGEEGRGGRKGGKEGRTC